MGVYDNRARQSFDGDLALIITDQLTTVTRTRKIHADPTRGATENVLGPLSVRIDGFRATRSAANGRPLVPTAKGWPGVSRWSRGWRPSGANTSRSAPYCRSRARSRVHPRRHR